MKQPPQQLEPISVTVDRAAELLGVSRRKVYQLLASQKLSRCRIGNRTLIPYDDLKALVLANTVRPR